MAQDLVTAKDVAAADDVALQFQDAQLICDKLDDALAKEKYRPTAYSQPVRSLFQVAWAAASHAQNRQVSVYHLAYALLRSQPETGKELAACLKTDAESFAVGCVLGFLTLGVSTGDRNIVPPAVDAVRWLGKGAALALERGEHSELLPTDLVLAVQKRTIPQSVRGLLSSAARWGAKRRHAILGPRSAPSIPAAPPTPEDIVRDIETSRTTAALVLLEEIDKPRPPSGARLAAAIIGVLAIGVATGLGLQFPKPLGTFLAQVFSASVK
jgi:hypothetical protein